MARGFYVRNDGELRFADWLADEWKRTETRNRRTLDKLVATGSPEDLVYIIRTEAGKPATVIATCWISGPYWCPADRFQTESVRQAHRVPAGSKYDARPGTGKWLYDLWDVERVEPFPVPANATRHGRVWCEW